MPTALAQGKPNQWGPVSPALLHPAFRWRRDGLVGHWIFWEGAGGHIWDISGYEHHGTRQGNSTWLTTPYGPGMTFNGDGSQYIDAGLPQQYVDLTDITAACWVRINVTNGRQDFFSIWGGADAGGDDDKFLLSWDISGDAFNFYWKSGSAGSFPNVNSSSITDQLWHHVAATWDQVTARLYIDGVEVDSDGTNAGPLVTTQVGSTLRIGESADDGGNVQIAEARLYDRALTAAEVQDLYERPFADVYPGWWDFPALVVAGAGPTEVTVTAAQPAATAGVTSVYQIGISAAQPAPSAVVTAQQTLAIGVAAAQPAATAVVTSLQTLLRTLTANQPSATAGFNTVIPGHIKYLITLTAAQGAPSATVTAQAITALTVEAAQPAASADVSLEYLIALLASQPAASADVTALQTLARTLTAAQGAPSATVTALQTLQKVLTAAQPAASATLALLYLIAITANQPSATAGVSSEEVQPQVIGLPRTLRDLGDFRNLADLGDFRRLYRLG